MPGRAYLTVRADTYCATSNGLTVAKSLNDGYRTSRYQAQETPPANCRSGDRSCASAVATYRAVFPGYFRTMSIPILRGRDVTDADNLRAPGVVVINDYLARRYWPGEGAIGKRITFDHPAKNPSWLTVVGVVKDTVRSSWVGPAEEEVFQPFLQNRAYLDNPSQPFAYLTLVVRTTGEPGSLAPAIRGAGTYAPVFRVANSCCNAGLVNRNRNRDHWDPLCQRFKGSIQSGLRNWIP